MDAEAAPEADAHAVTDGDTDREPVKDIEWLPLPERVADAVALYDEL